MASQISTTSNEKIEKLTVLLRQLFQLNDPNLDFGIYRIMHAVKDRIDNLLGNKLADRIKQELSASGCSGDEKKALLTEVCDDLLRFFSRYYIDGDFMPRRLYKGKKEYMIPYNGEETFFWWTNADQYYIKTTDFLSELSFTAKGLGDVDYRVSFKLRQAEEGEHGNIKDDKKRLFIPCTDFIEEQPESNAVIFWFEHRAPADTDDVTAPNLESAPVDQGTGTQGQGKKKKELGISDQEYWFEEAEKRLSSLSDSLLEKTLLLRDSNGKTEFGKRLSQWTARNTFDFFIHKDLGAFLRRELDFYLKNDILSVDSLLQKDGGKVNRARCIAVKAIAEDIISFLAQTENFQKKLWLKKKFVVETNYCVTLDLVPEELYDKIVNNVDQIEEWKRLFAIEEIDRSEIPLQERSQREQTSLVDREFLIDNKYLVLDTKFFDMDFKERLLESIDQIDCKTDGLLIQSENTQALNLLGSKFRKEIRCIYVDPPYNTGTAENDSSFIYKNQYKDSSWLSMINASVISSCPLMTDDAVFMIAIDDYELTNLEMACDKIFDKENRLGVLIVEIKRSGRSNANYLATSHEYILFYESTVDTADICFFPLTEEQEKQFKFGEGNCRYKWRDFLRTGGLSYPSQRQNQCYPIYYNPTTNKITLEELDGFQRIDPVDSVGVMRVWRKKRESFLKHLENDEIKVENGKVKIKDYIKLGRRPKSVWADRRYDASAHGTKLITKMFGKGVQATYPKSINAVRDCIFLVLGKIEESDSPFTLDYFAGSGTTGHAVINLNREDGGKRRYILIEMGNHFNTVLKPRIEKAVYSDAWADGVPVNRNTGISQLIKYQRLESYEDTLNNIQIKKNREVQGNFLEGDENNVTRNSYFLNYMLDFETRDSASLLNRDSFVDPFNYRLTIWNSEKGVNEEKAIDLVETFNYLIGLRCDKVFASQFLLEDNAGISDVHNEEWGTKTAWQFKAVTGFLPSDERVLIVWRNHNQKSDETTPEFDESDNNALNNWLKNNLDKFKNGTPFDLLYVNGTNTVKADDVLDREFRRVEITENVFKDRMFS